MVDLQNNKQNSRKIRTVLVQRYFPHYRKAIFRALATHPKIDFLLLHGEQDGPAGLTNVRNDEVIRCWVEPTVSVGPSKLGLYAMPHMVKCAKTYDYDVMILQTDFHCLTLWPAMMAIRKRGKRMSDFTIGFGQKPALVRDRIRIWLANTMDSNIFYSYQHRQRFIARGVPAEKIFVAPNAFDTAFIRSAEAKVTDSALDEFKTHHNLSEGNTIIHAGRMVDYKRLDLLLYAAAKLVSKRPKLKLILIGDGPMLEPWRQLAENLHISEHVIWPGMIVDQNQLCYWFHSSDICVAPGQHGLLANLTHTYGVPFITSDYEFLQGPEIQVFTENKTGLFYSYEDIDDLVKKIEELLDNPNRRAEMSQEARRVIDEGFTLEKMCQGFIDGICYAAEH